MAKTAILDGRDAVQHIITSSIGQTRKLNPKPLMRLRRELVSMLMS